MQTNVTSIGRLKADLNGHGACIYSPQVTERDFK